MLKLLSALVILTRTGEHWKGGGGTLIGSLTALSLRMISGSFVTRTQLKLIKLKLSTCCSLLRSSLQENTLMNTFSIFGL